MKTKQDGVDEDKETNKINFLIVKNTLTIDDNELV
jgi:hypothetical protein